MEKTCPLSLSTFTTTKGKLLLSVSHTVEALVYPVLVYRSVRVGVHQRLGLLGYCGEIPFPGFSVESDCVF